MVLMVFVATKFFKRSGLERIRIIKEIASQRRTRKEHQCIKEITQIIVELFYLVIPLNLPTSAKPSQTWTRPEITNDEMIPLIQGPKQCLHDCPGLK